MCDVSFGWKEAQMGTAASRLASGTASPHTTGHRLGMRLGVAALGSTQEICATSPLAFTQETTRVSCCYNFTAPSNSRVRYEARTVWNGMWSVPVHCAGTHGSRSALTSQRETTCYSKILLRYSITSYLIACV